MDQEDKNKVTQVIANGILNSLNINGLLEAAKSYSIGLAKDKVEEMSNEELAESLEKINEISDQAADEPADAPADAPADEDS